MLHAHFGPISGISNRSLYLKLLTWNHKIPLRGYKEDRTTFTIELLKDWGKNKSSRGWNATWISTNRFHGMFQIIDRDFSNEEKEEVVIQCLWTTGESAGKTFLIKPRIDLDVSGLILNAIYTPPRVFVVFIEITISAGAIAAFLKLTEGWWKIGRAHV